MLKVFFGATRRIGAFVALYQWTVERGATRQDPLHEAVRAKRERGNLRRDAREGKRRNCAPGHKALEPGAASRNGNDNFRLDPKLDSNLMAYC